MITRWGSICLAAGMLAASTGALAESDNCEACHQDPGFLVTQRKLYDYYQKWRDSVHHEAGVNCSDCHGGDPEATVRDETEVHDNVLPPSDPASKIHYKNLPATCGTCHQGVFMEFVASEHYQELQQSQNAPHCATCHGAMNSRVYYEDIVGSTCRTCHDDGDLADVTVQAETILNRLRVARGYMEWTRLYYENQGQPQEIAALYQRYRQITDGWHRFELDEVDKDSAELMTELQAVFTKAWEERTGLLAP